MILVEVVARRRGAKVMGGGEHGGELAKANLTLTLSHA